MYSSETVSGSSLGLILRVSNKPFNSSKVRTRSTSPIRSFSLASAFFAIQGPINTTLTSGLSFFNTLAAAIIGDTDGVTYLTKSL